MNRPMAAISMSKVPLNVRQPSYLYSYGSRLLCTRSTILLSQTPTIKTPTTPPPPKKPTARRLPPQTPSLSSFLLRSKVLSLYRTILRSARHIPLKEDRDFVYDWARSDFERYRNETDVDKIKMLLSQGQVQAKTLDRSVTLSKAAFEKPARRI